MTQHITRRRADPSPWRRRVARWAPFSVSALVGACGGDLGAHDGLDATGASGIGPSGAASGSAGSPSNGAEGNGAAGGGVLGPSASPSETTGSAGAASGGPATDVRPPADATVVSQLCSDLGVGVHAGLTRLRRLTRAAYNHTVADLLGIAGDPSAGIELDESIGPFHSNAIAPVTDLIVRQHQEAADAVAGQAVPRMAEIAGCDLSADATCVGEFVGSFGAKAFRRPLDAAEQQSYVELFAAGAEEGGVEGGFRLVVSTMLQSPFFLYHVEHGATGEPSATTQPLTGYELASRLSYFLWNTMPDDELFALAAAGTLADPATLTTQVERMLADPKAAASIAEFHLRWLGVGGMESTTKLPSLYPEFDDPLKSAMLQELGAFSAYVVRQGDGLLGTLLTASYSFPTGPLFDLYGIPEPSGFQPGAPVDMDPLQRAGLLTMPAFLTKHAHPDQTSPVHRGIIVRENLLCQTIPAPPPDVDNVAPAPTETSTTRERFAQHEADPVCGSCHVLIDPIGLGFENYDAIGAWRDTENGRLVDATGSVTAAGSDVDGDFDGAVELAAKMAQSEQVKVCVANQWFRYSLGRMESNDDACTLQTLYDAFASSGGDVRALLATLATSPAFTHTRTLAGGQ